MFPTFGEDMMKEWAENWEKLMGTQLEKLVQDEKFISEMAKSIAGTMTGKAFYTKAVDQQLAAMNLPSRTEVVKVLQKVTDVEERLIDLTEKFEDFTEEFREAIAKHTQTASAATPAANKKQKGGK
jgi:hypothetical protein